MDTSGALGTWDENMVKVIKTYFGEDDKTMEILVDLFKNWLKSDARLPKNVDEQVIKNYIRHCKFDLEFAKKKFELYLESRIRIQNYLPKVETPDCFDDVLHRQIAAVPQLTPEGYRIGISILPEDVNHFNFCRYVNCAAAILDLLNHRDYVTGYVGIFDLKYATLQHLGKVSFELASEFIHLIFKAAPFKPIRLHFVNVSQIPEAIINFAKKVANEEVMSKVYVHKDLSELTTYYPTEILPTEYGGTWAGLFENVEPMKRALLNEEFRRNCENLNLVEPSTYPKQDQYFQEEFKSSGNLRKLNID